MGIINTNSAVFLLVAATLVWAATGISWKFFSLAGIAFIVIFLVSRLFKFLAVWFISYYRIKQREPIKNFRELGIIFLNACFSVGTPFFYFLAISETSVSNAYFLLYTMPAWVLIAAVLFLGEKITKKKIAGLLLTTCGILLIASPWNGGFQISLGLIFGLLSAFSHTGDIITSRELKDYSYHTVSFYTNLMQLFIVAAMTPLLLNPGDLQIGLPNIAILAVTGALLGIASDMYYHALDTLEASRAAIISFSELIFAVVLAFIFFSEMPNGSELAGYALILIAGAIIIFRKADIERFEHLLRFTDRQ
ncbi:MAG TPA: DMT family transporter [archaeon]|nr:DMT family transporter [archaeon]